MSRYYINEEIKRVFGERLSAEGLADALAEPSSKHEPWLREQSEDAVAGLRDECLNYIRHWGNGGGSYSTEMCVQNALDEVDVDAPKVLAEIILRALEMNGETPMEATVLTMDIINDSLSELKFRRDKAQAHDA